MFSPTTLTCRKMSTIVLLGEKTSIFKLNQWCRLYQRDLTSLEHGRRQHERMYHTFYLSPVKVRCLRQKTPSVVFSKFYIEGSRKNMSILTDLLRRKKPEEDEDEVIPDAKSLPLLDDSGSRDLTDEEVEAKRNVSRLSISHQRLVHGQHPHVEPKMWIHHTVRYKQKTFGRYGESSGVNPGILWYTREELHERIEYERIAHPFTIQEMVEKKRAFRQSEKEAMERRVKEVEDNMALVDKFKEDLDKRQKTKEREAHAATAKREKLMEEVRRHFGYTIDPRDDKFQELLAKKEKEERKKLKEARKLEKQQRILNKLDALSANAKTGNKKVKDTKDSKDDEE